MIRSDKEITDPVWIDHVLCQGLYCHIAIIDGTLPYLAPLNYLWCDGKIILHSGLEGEKIRILKRNPSISFAVETDVEMVPGSIPCQYSMRYRSVIGQGTAVFVEDPIEKSGLLCRLAEKYTGVHVSGFSSKSLDQVVVISITISQMTGKNSGYPL